MRKLSALLIVAAVAAAASLSQPALAQDKAAEVLANVRQALGAGKLDSLITFSLEAKTARNTATRQFTTDVELYLDLPDKFLRVDNITAPIAASMASGFNGDKMIRPDGGMGMGMPMIAMGGGGGRGGGGAMTVMTRVGADGARGGSGGGPPTPEQQAMMDASMIRAQRVELSRLMLGWFAMAHPSLKATYTYGGEAESPDGKAHIIDVKADGGFAARLFVDQVTNVPLMLTYQGPEPRTITRGGPPAGAPIVSTGAAGHTGAGHAGPPPPPPPPPGGQVQMTQEEMQAIRNQPPRMIEYRVYFGDWKEVDGILFPHSLQRATGDTTTEEWTIAKVKVNPKIDAKKFQ